MATRRRKTIVCDVGALSPDARTIDALARLQLTLRRVGLEMQLRNAPQELQELLVLVGLSDVLGVESSGQAEEREQRLGVEKERELEDPSR